MSASASGAARRRRLAALRGAGFAVAIALGGVAVWLIVTSTSQKRIEIGILTGLWGLLLGSYSVFGSRAPNRAAVVPTEAPPGPAGQSLDVRQVGEIERAAVAAARREFRIELEQMLRHEVQAGLAKEVAGLRNEVAALRNELVEKVGGQLRLERIETTRLIGSDLEALQHELRQLRHVGGGESDGDAVPTVSITKAVGAIPMPVHDDIEDAEIVVEQPLPQAVPPHAVPPPWPPNARVQEGAPAPQPVAVERVAAESVSAEEAPEPAKAAPEPAEQAPEPAEQATRVAAPQSQSADPFASLPRITPFTDFALDPITPELAAPATKGAAVAAGRHSTGDDAAAHGRRHRADDSANDVLARILAREHP